MILDLDLQKRDGLTKKRKVESKRNISAFESRKIIFLNFLLLIHRRDYNNKQFIVLKIILLLR
jgi:hypothetical protein